ncbi:putative multifunctional methyltransferase subunit TRM112 [Blattamonas nauphoetae]|uniref:Multifunctional methyltransferase subunit TRM112 n=1 Tax=Blattamonas nauphoetae TaxID=2049346 RepID=A0ABQ9X9R1_9EUKA|nr:putative multifunctional methyltransferase subunit TRM112 [Blattamonas nauphoetae]
MKLLTHNLLQCIVPACRKHHYPLKVTASLLNVEENPFDAIFASRMLERLEYNILLEAYNSLRQDGQPELPPAVPEDGASNEVFLQSLFFAINCLDVVEGAMTCSSCGRIYPIHNSIPNMIVRAIEGEQPPQSIEKEQEDEEEEESEN